MRLQDFIYTQEEAAVLDHLFAQVRWREILVLPRVACIPRGYSAITIWRMIVQRSAVRLPFRTLAHEIQHVAQYQRDGVWRFLWQYFWDAFRHQWVHNDMLYESEAAEVARLAEDMVRHRQGL